VYIRPAVDPDMGWRVRLLSQHFSSPTVVAHGRLYLAASLPGLVCVDDRGDRIGVLSYEIAARQLEIISINAAPRGQGAGTALLSAAVGLARAERCRRAWLVTTNDNLDALRFYQRRGWRLVRVHRGAVDAGRPLKPTLPVVGEYGIEMHDELELEILTVGGQ
jgi:GNAT superfamily N-acetyltransferase